jgi:hypothetical protein
MVSHRNTAPRPPEEDPILRSLREAPLDDEPETEEERLAVEEARRDIAAGRVYTLAEVAAELDVDLGD